MQTSKLGAALDLWCVKTLAGFGLRMRVRTFRALLLAAFLLVMPLVALVVTVLVSLSAVLVTGAQLGEPRNAEFVAGCAALLVVGCGYVGALDLLRQHFSTARYAVVRSPLKGIWLATDIPLVAAVLAERGLVLAWRALAQGAALGATSLYLYRSASAAAGDVAALALLIPLAYFAAGLCLALVHARRDSTAPAPVAGLAMSLVVAGITGFALAGLLSTVSIGVDRTQGLAEGLADLGQVLGAFRLVAVAVLVLAIAALTIALALSSEHELNPRRPTPAKTSEASDGATTASAIWVGAGGPVRLQVALRILAVIGAAGVGALGWRLGGGSVVPENLVVAFDRLLVVASAGVGVGLASVALLAVGQTRLLWHYRILWESGLTTRRLLAASLRPSVVLVAVASLGLALASVSLAARVPVTALVVLVCAALSEHLVDSLMAGPDTREGARSDNSLLAVVSYLFVVPPLLIGLIDAGWVLPTLLLIALGYLTGGAWWFSARIRTLPMTSVA